MLYINQRNYAYIPYMHDINNPDKPPEKRTISSSGCGLCCACMMLEHLTRHTLTLEQMIQHSYDSFANVRVGTQMIKLGPYLAEKYNLEFKATKSTEEVIQCLRDGGEVIINVGGSHDDYIGLYSTNGHYIIAIAYDGNELCILDPSYREDKYEIEPHAGKVRVNAPFTYCSIKTIEDDTQNRETPFYLFKRK